MITKIQLDELSRYYHVDSFTIFREYLQLLFLNQLYTHKKTDKVYFKGGTAIHLFYDSPRFSEDLDFSTSLDRKEVGEILKEANEKLKIEVENIRIIPLYPGRAGVRFRLIHKSSDFKYPLAIRLDFALKQRPQKLQISPLVTKFPIVFLPLIVHLSKEEILAEKTRALLTRGKGRDFYDLWFLLEKGIALERSLVEKKLQEIGRVFEKRELIKKIKNKPPRAIELDLTKFLPQPQRKIIPILKENLLEVLEKNEQI